MRRWLFVSRESTTTELSKREVLPDSGFEDRSDGCPEGRWRYEFRTRYWRHHVDFVACPPEYEVVERKYVTWQWLPVCFASYACLVVSDALLPTLVCAVVFAGLFSVLLLNTGPLSGFWKRSDSDGVDLFPLLPVLVVLFVGVPVDAVVGPPDWLSAGFSLVVFGLYWLGEEKVVGFSESWQGSIVERSKALPHVVVEYSVFVLMMSVPLLIFLFSSYSPVILRLLAGDVPVLTAYALLSSVAWVGAVWVTYRRSYEYTRVSYDLWGQRGGRVVRRGFGVFAVFVSLFVGSLGWLFFSRVRVLFSMDMLAGVVVALSGGWPILFVVGGLLPRFAAD